MTPSNDPFPARPENLQLDTDSVQDIDQDDRTPTLIRLERLLGQAGLLREPADLERYSTDASGLRAGLPLAVLRPATTADCAAAVGICAAAGLGMVPQGGRTGLSGGGVALPGAVILSTERLRGCQIDPQAMTLTAGAGTPLQQVQEAARAVGLEYPVDIGARGTATIGGTVATNAGGIRVLRHGMTRRHVLGLEAVLPDGRVYGRMNGLVKDNAGYDLSQLFIGSEGSLGVITRVVLQLCPHEAQSALILLACDSHAAAMNCLAAARAAFGERLSAFEGMWPDYWTAICRDWRLAASPFDADYGFYVLMELTARQAEDLAGLKDWLGDQMERGLIRDGVLARSVEEERRLWSLREAVGEVDAAMGPHISFDLSVAPAELGRFCDRADVVLAECPAATGWIKVGHIGDGNVHLLVAHGDDPADKAQIEAAVYALAGARGGSITAEHGIGRLKRAWHGTCRGPVELALSRAVKTAVDPRGLMNPGVLHAPYGGAAG